ncbi:MAG: hypothetical protein MHM6MM_008877 [Cercozoa sp. M6MM]
MVRTYEVYETPHTAWIAVCIVAGVVCGSIGAFVPPFVSNSEGRRPAVARVLVQSTLATSFVLSLLLATRVAEPVLITKSHDLIHVSNRGSYVLYRIVISFIAAVAGMAADSHYVLRLVATLGALFALLSSATSLTAFAAEIDCAELRGCSTTSQELRQLKLLCLRDCCELALNMAALTVLAVFFVDHGVLKDRFALPAVPDRNSAQETGHSQ